MQLVLQYRCKTSWIAMLRVLPPTIEPLTSLLQDRFYVGGRTRNIAMQHVLQ